jgi:hypothetical protein
MTDEPEYPDAEAERLLAEYGRAVRACMDAQIVPPEESKVGQAMRARDERVARGEMERIQKALNALGSTPNASGILKLVPIEPDFPLLAGPPSWRTSSYVARPAGSKNTPTENTPPENAARARADDVIAQAVEDAHAAFDANPRDTRPCVVALQVLDHYLVRGEVLPARPLELLRRTLRLDAKSIVAAKRRARIAAADEAGTGTKAIAAEEGISERAVRALRQPVEQSDALVHLMALEHHPPRRSARDEIVKLLDLPGRTVTEVTHDGFRHPARVRDAARTEARRRVVEKRKRKAANPDAVNPDAWDGTNHNDAKAIARAAKEDHRDVTAWTQHPGWEDAVVSEGFWLHGPRIRKRNHQAD